MSTTHTATAVEHNLDAPTFRRALGHVPTSVAVITATNDSQPVGMTVGSFSSISLDPPLVGFFADTNSATVAKLQASGRFCVNVLADEQKQACSSFATRTGDRFVGVDLLPGSPQAAPKLSGAVAWVDCDIEAVTEVGDHLLVVGRVTQLDVAAGNPRPLVFFRGSLCHLDRRTLPSKGDWQRDHYADW